MPDLPIKLTSGNRVTMSRRVSAGACFGQCSSVAFLGSLSEEICESSRSYSALASDLLKYYVCEFLVASQ